MREVFGKSLALKLLLKLQILQEILQSILKRQRIRWTNSILKILRNSILILKY